MKLGTVTVGSIAGVVILAGTLWTTLNPAANPWQSLGWTTNERHDTELATLRDDLESRITMTEEGSSKFYLHWRCDEWEEELLELLEKKAAGDDSVELQRRINKLRDRIDEKNCDQFDIE